MNNYVRIRITGRNTKMFIKRFLINQKINYHGYKELNFKQVELNISYQDYLKISKKSSIYEVNIVKLYGPIFLLNYIKSNLSFIISFIISLVLLYFISNFAFEVNVIHNDSNIRKLVYEELSNHGIDKYKIIPSFKKRRLIISDIIKNNKNKIEWLEIERSGSKLIVKVTERKINKKENIISNRHIVAKKSGIIMKIEAQDGVILKKKNDYVAKGEIIVSGDIIKDETVKGQVVANGSVYAETWYSVNVSYPLYYEEVTYLDEIKNNVIINFLSKSFSLKKNYVSSYLEKKRFLIKDKVFPFSIRMEKQRKTKVKKETLSIQKAILKAETMAEKKIKAKLSKDEYIISKKTLNFSSNESRIIVDVFFKVYEDITDYQDVDPNLLKTPLETE